MNGKLLLSFLLLLSACAPKETVHYSHASPAMLDPAVYEQNVDGCRLGVAKLVEYGYVRERDSDAHVQQCLLDKGYFRVDGEGRPLTGAENALRIPAEWTKADATPEDWNRDWLQCSRDAKRRIELLDLSYAAWPQFRSDCLRMKGWVCHGPNCPS